MVSVDPLLHWYEASAVGAALRSADPAVMQLTQLFHVFGLVILLSSTALLSLRLLDKVLTFVPVPRLTQTLKPFVLIGILVTVLSGVLMFLTAPGLYNINTAFWPKVALLALAIVVQLGLLRSLKANAAPNSWLARSGAVLTILLWVGVAAAGRAIGYVC